MKHSILGLAVAILAGGAAAQGVQDHLRGKIVSLTADSLIVQPRHGKPQAVKLAPDWAVVVMKPVAADAIQPGSFIGTTEIERPDGVGHSLEVHVFPPGVKIGEGHYPWDLKPRSMMTNGTVGKVVAGSKGRMLEVAYPGGVRRILVPPGVPIVATAPGDRAMVKRGVAVFIPTAVGPGGGPTANRVLVGQGGAPPPM